jgi:acyl-coenzyme A synthetase/AMP-(fatty) acid ligase
LEDVLLSHPGVKDAAVIGVKDEMAGEAPKAFIVKATPELEAMEIMDYIKGESIFIGQRLANV